jgi:alkyldihydroxyacetonephosphate synthase
MSVISNELLNGELRRICGSRNVVDRESDRIAHSLNRNWYVRTLWARNRSIPMADVIVYPETTEQVSQILRLANQEKVPVTPFGGGSSGMGGNVAEHGGIVVDMKKMNRMLSVNEHSLMVMVEAGINCWEYEDELNKLGYTSGHVPASFFCSTIGGFLALRSAGRLSTGYGKIENMALALEVVMPSGEVVHTRPVPAHAAGPDLNQLFIGSEGAYGIITRATLKIHPYPEERRFRAMLFPDLHTGIEAIRKILRSGVHLIIGRLYDERETAGLFKKTWGLEQEGAYAVVGFDGNREKVDVEEKMTLEVCRQEGGEDLGREKGEHWWENRFGDYYPADQKDVDRYHALLGGGKLAGGTMDVSAPYNQIEDLYREAKEAFLQRFGQRYTADIYAHFSHWYKHGTMFYCRWHLGDISKDDDIVALYTDVWSTLIPVAIAHEGVIEHHHGVGRLLGRFLKLQDSGSFTVLREIKKALDPNNIMNPGVMGLGDY